MASRSSHLPRFLVAVCLLAVPAWAQPPEPPPSAPPAEPQPAPAAAAPAEPQTPAAAAAPAPGEPPAPAVPEPSGAAGSVEGDGADETEGVEVPPRSSEEGGILPRLDVYFPEGDLDLRVNRLINKTFFEGQVKYNFIQGDITAFLRYRYYGYNRTTQLTAFDAIDFDDIDQNVTSDFDRVRGLLTLLQWPHSYNHRTSAHFEIDRISSNRGERGSDFFVRRDGTNTFVRLGYQLGAPDEGRSSAIAGETRARTERLFSAFREFGPGESTFTAAVTYSFPLGFADFDYLKIEFEALKRFDVSTRTFRAAVSEPGRDRLLRRSTLRGLPARRPGEPQGLERPPARPRAAVHHLGVLLPLVSREPPSILEVGVSELVLDLVHGNRYDRPGPEGLYGLRYLCPRRRHRL
jgi:hypothetical protein